MRDVEGRIEIFGTGSYTTKRTAIASYDRPKLKREKNACQKNDARIAKANDIGRAETPLLGACQLAGVHDAIMSIS